MDDLCAKTEARHSELFAGLTDLEGKMKDELEEIKGLKGRMKAVEEGGLDHSHERIDALEAALKGCQEELVASAEGLAEVKAGASAAEVRMAATEDALALAADAAAQAKALLEAAESGLNKKLVAVAAEVASQAVAHQSVVASAAAAAEAATAEAATAAAANLASCRAELEEMIHHARDEAGKAERAAKDAEDAARAAATEERFVAAEADLAYLKACADLAEAGLGKLKGVLGELALDVHHHDATPEVRAARLAAAGGASGGEADEAKKGEAATAAAAAAAKGAFGAGTTSVPFHALADVRSVEEHDKLLRALVRKVNAQGRCLQGLVADARARREHEAMLRKQNDGIAVQCLSCLRPAPELFPRAREVDSFTGQPLFGEVGGLATLPANPGTGFGAATGGARPKSAKARASGSKGQGGGGLEVNAATGPRLSGPLSAFDGYGGAPGSVGYAKHMRGDGGGGVFLGGQGLAGSAVAQRFGGRHSPADNAVLDPSARADDAKGNAAGTGADDGLLWEELATGGSAGRQGDAGEAAGPANKYLVAYQNAQNQISAETRRSVGAQASGGSGLPHRTTSNVVGNRPGSAKASAARPRSAGASRPSALGGEKKEPVASAAPAGTVAGSGAAAAAAVAAAKGGEDGNWEALM